jgi:hypothetical protein
MRKIPNLDIHITHKCNFTCEGCSHFMNHGFETHIGLEECEKWMLNWNTRILPQNIGILGGEPFLHNNLKEYCHLTRKMWPNSQIEIVTNLSLIHLQPKVFEDIIQNNIILSISFHSKDPDYIKMIKKKLPIIKEWQNKGLNVRTYDSYSNWSLIYKGFGDKIMPFEDDDPESSWKNCPTGQSCFQLHQGKIWKCAPLAFLPMMKEKYNISEKWDPYLNYVPLSPECSDEELEKFFNRGSEKFCSMCPANKKNFNKSSPLLRKNDFKS